MPNPMMNEMLQGADMRSMLLAQVVIWVAAIVGLVLIARQIAQTIGARYETPLQVVQRRLANGAISRDEYYIVQRILTQANAPDAQPAPAAPPRATS